MHSLPMSMHKSKKPTNPAIKKKKHTANIKSYIDVSPIFLQVSFTSQLYQDELESDYHKGCPIEGKLELVGD